MYIKNKKKLYHREKARFELGKTSIFSMAQFFFEDRIFQKKKKILEKLKVFF